MDNITKLFEEYLEQKCDGKSGKIDKSVADLGIFKITKNIGNDVIESIRRSYGKNLPIPHIGYIDETTINACAFIYDDKDFIGINAGTVLILFDVFSRILAHPELFLEIGDPFKEIVPEKYYDSIEDFKNIDQNDTVIPRDPIRRDHAFELAFTALSFLITHEYGHLIHGHVHLNNQQQGGTNLFELDQNEVSGKKSIGGMIRQTLEMDADMFATNIGVRFIVANVNLLISSEDQIPTFYTSIENALYNWLFAIYLMFRLFEGRYNYNTLDTLNYPPPTVRTFYIMSTIITNYPVNNHPEHYIADILVKAMMDCENALDKIFYNEMGKQSLAFEYIKAAQYHSSKLTHNWKNVAPLLKPFSRGDLAPLPD